MFLFLFLKKQKHKLLLESFKKTFFSFGLSYMYQQLEWFFKI